MVSGAHSRNCRSSLTLEPVYDTSKAKSTCITEQGVTLSEGGRILTYNTLENTGGNH